LGHISPELVSQLESSARHSVEDKIAGIKESVPQVLTSLAQVLSIGLFVPIIAFFFLVEGAEIKKWIIRLLPNRYFEMTLVMLHNVNTQLGGYLRGQAMDCIINGILYSIGLSLLGVKGGIVIGCFAGLMNAVPYVGPIIGAIPGMFSLMLDPSATMPWWSVAVLFLCIHLIDNVVIYPATVGKSLSLPPFVVILGILFGGSIAGIPGMFLTVPLLGMARQMFSVFRHSLKSYKII
jgi:putative permease